MLVRIAFPYPVQVEPDGARYRTLCRTADYDAALVHYPAHVHHPDHEHDRAQLTFLLCGGFADDWEGRESEPSGSRHGLRPEGARHSCRFGPDGALILSVNFRAGAQVPVVTENWRPSGPSLGRLYRLLFEAILPPEQVVDDLIGAAAAGEQRSAPRGLSEAPQWLRMAVDELAAEPSADIAAVAVRAGVHRVSLSRAFHKHLGVSPSQFRLQCKSARALRHLVEGGEAPCMAAAEGGFADQAHWTRTSRASAGMGPAKLRHLLTV